ncbi:V-set and immunoglobulin domain-containing protein 4 isoform X2 [Paroedura picta]|uniref:V-set and immunoglobulin domain-containing protein 4 isoform X2 n=1 Tax=Paroedura picta TaxID=143630 RepID=UPI0040564F92
MDHQPLCFWLLLLTCTGCGKALLDLTGVQEIEGTWKASVRLPCVYGPSADFRQVTVLWKASLADHGIRTIFRRDPDSGDQTLFTNFRNRIRVPKEPPGDVSLLIEDLEMNDRGQYTCEVVWVTRNKSRMTRERTTVLSVIKVAVTKPTITAGTTESILPTGRNTSLTCHAYGSPPIQYRWLRATQGGNDVPVSQNAVLRFDSLQVLDAGTYYCEAGNRVSSAVQRSDAFQLTVEDPSEIPTLQPSSENANTHIAKRETVTAEWKFRAGSTASPLGPRRTSPTRDLVPTSVVSQRDGSILEQHASNSALRKAGLPLYIIAVIVVLCVMMLLAVLTIIFCRKKLKRDHIYKMSYRPVTVGREEATCDAAAPFRCESVQATPRVENNYSMEPTETSEYVRMDTKLDNEYEILIRKMESEYEVVGTEGVAACRPSS